MREGLGVDRYTKTVSTLMVVLLATLSCKPFLIAKPVTTYNTTTDDAYYCADDVDRGFLVTHG